MKRKKIFVIDTNVILHDLNFCVSFEEHDIVIPIQVLSELDKFKKGDDVINFNARDFTRFIDGLPSEKVFDGGAPLGEGLGKIRISVGLNYHESVSKIFPERSIDHEIINTAYCLSQDENIEIIFVSKDVNLRMKAKSLGLKAEDFKSDAVVDVKALYEDVKRISTEEKVITSLYSNNEIDFTSDELIQNEFLILHSLNDKNSALAFFRSGKLQLVKKENVSSFGIKPKNAEQAFVMHALLNPKITLLTIMGKAGTGKTILSLATGLQLIDQRTFDQVYFTRQIVAMGNKEIGFLPGDEKEKISPYMQGMYDNLAVISSSDFKLSRKIEEFKKESKIFIQPLSSIRGRSLVNKFFIIDEAQNLTPNEVKTIITRAGEGTKIVLMGDISQIDSPYLDQRSNGLVYVISRMKGQDFYSHVNLLKGERSLMSEVAGNLL